LQIGIEHIKNEQARGKKVCLYPVTHGSEKFFRALFESYGVRVDNISDIDKSLHGTLQGGLIVISPDELLANQDSYLIIMTGMSSDRIIRHLLNFGIKEENICDILGNMRRRLVPPGYYFNHEFFSPQNDEIYIDLGPETGAEALDFIKFCNGNYKKLFLFEPCEECLAKVRGNLANTKNVEIIPKAAYSSSETVDFVSAGEASHVLRGAENKYYVVPNESEIIKVDAITVDEVAGGSAVTFIKMDIEGGEMFALEGARNTIIKNKPRMAVCIYHKPEDIYTIPEFILSCRSDYKFYIRHHAFTDGDLVLYCV